ncbi:MAG: hypothetical protein KGZ30_04380 [Anaplasmataceae bacterium]|nr:hypothetical protein [Anaplasmataceae bacterium]
MTILVAFSLGYIAANFLAGPETGVPGRIRSIRFSIKNYVVHLHHWFIASTTGVFLFLGEVERLVIYAFLLGIIIQGLTYRDFHRLIYKITD